MSNADMDPRRLDVVAFAADAGEIECTWPITRLPRLAESVFDPAALAQAGSNEVTCHAQGYEVPLQVGPAEVWMHLRARTEVTLQCQRCLAPVGLQLLVDKRLRFVENEAKAAALDAELEEEDVLVQQPDLCLRTLVEDELLLALPIVPRHEVCPEPLPWLPDPPEAAEAPNPFAVLAGFKSAGRQ